MAKYTLHALAADKEEFGLQLEAGKGCFVHPLFWEGG